MKKIFLLPALLLGMISGRAQTLNDANPKLVVDWQHINLGDQERTETLMNPQNQALGTAFDFAIQCLKNARTRLAGLLAAHEQNNIPEEYAVDMQIIESTVKLKRQDYTLYLGDMITSIDNILNGNVPTVRVSDVDYGECVNWGTCGFVWIDTLIAQKPELADILAFCWNKMDQYVNYKTNKGYCYSLLFIHELHHLRNRKYHGMVKLGQGVFMYDAFNFSNMVVQLSVSNEDWEKYQDCPCFGTDGRAKN